MTFVLCLGYLTAQGVDCHQVVFFENLGYLTPQRLDCHRDSCSLLGIFKYI